MQILKSIWLEEDGATIAEYAMMIALIAAGAVTVIGVLSAAVNTKFEAATNGFG